MTSIGAPIARGSTSRLLQEGTEQDVRRFVRAEDLLELWDELVLPAHVRAAWSDWISRHRAGDESTELDLGVASTAGAVEKNSCRWRRAMSV